MRSPISRPSAPPKAPPEMLLEQALSAHSRNDLSKAEDLYRQYLTFEPDNAQVLHYLGVIGLQSGHPAAAAKIIQKSLEHDSTSVDAYCNLGLALKRAGDLEAAEAAYRRAIEIDPTIAEAHANLGVLLRELQRNSDARKAFETAKSLAPEEGSIWSNLGILETQEDRLDQAIEYFQKAHQLEPGNSQILGNLGSALAKSGKNTEAIDVLLRALEMDPVSAELNYNLAKSYFSLGNVEAAIRYNRQALGLDPNFVDAHHNLGHALLAAGNIKQGWREYDWRWRSLNYHDTRKIPDVPLWAGEKLDGKHLLIWSEQGVGDKLLFAGLIPEVLARGGQITLETEDRLLELFRRSFPSLSVTGTFAEDGVYDYQIPMGSLPGLFRNAPENFQNPLSYLIPDPQKLQELRSKYTENGEFLVGISWASKPPKGIALEALLPILKLPGLKVFNLQYGDHSTEISEFSRRHGVEVYTDEEIDPLSDIDGFTSQVAAMDAVVTIQNTTLYTAGGLGIPTYAILPPVPDWRWLGQSEMSPWHQSVHLFHRSGKDAGALETIVESVKDQIEVLVRSK